MAVAYMILTKALAEEGLSFGQEPVGKDGKPIAFYASNVEPQDEELVTAIEAALAR